MATTITATLVKELRSRTGVGMMDCKKALVSAHGDIDAAAEAMRKSGQIQAEKKSGRIAAEGLIFIKSKAEQSIMIEINCETDFVSRDDSFKQFAEAVAQLAVDNKIKTIEELLVASFPETGESVENTRQNLIAKLGENIKIRRLAFVTTQPDTVLGAYVHSGRIGAIVQLRGGDKQLAEDLTLQIIANNPLGISPEEVPEEILAKEREIFMAQAQASGKPQAIIDKMVDGRIDKFLNEVSLLGQVFIKDDTLSIKKLLRSAQAEVVSFVRFEVGEGIEKPPEDFATAVMDQVKAS